MQRGKCTVRFGCLLAIVFCFLLIGCEDQAAFMKRVTPPEDESIVENYVDLLRQGKYDQILRNLDPGVRDPDDRKRFDEMASYFPNGTPESIKVVGFRMPSGQQYPTTDVTLEYQFPKRWLAVELITRENVNSSTILSFQVFPLADSLENLNRFTLVGKSVVQYWILILALCSLVFSFYALMLCIGAKDVKRKWLWMLFILVGVEKLAVDWNTGKLIFGILAVYIPSAIASHPPYGPWTIGACFPLGAVLFWKRQRKMRIARESIPPLMESAWKKRGTYAWRMDTACIGA
jgi:hypothetical protein